MYSFIEIEQIFRNCMNWNDLESVCKLFIGYVVPDGNLSFDKMNFISEKSMQRFRELENL